MQITFTLSDSQLGGLEFYRTRHNATRRRADKESVDLTLAQIVHLVMEMAADNYAREASDARWEQRRAKIEADTTLARTVDEASIEPVR